jgi:hypothetical protein
LALQRPSLACGCRMWNKSCEQIYAGKQVEEELPKLLEKQCGFYRVILELARNEHEKYTTHKPINEIVPLMKKKQILLACVEEIEEKIQPLKKSWKGRGGHSVQEEEFYQGLFEGIENLLAEIVTIDKANEAMLMAYMDALQKKKDKLSQNNSS